MNTTLTSSPPEPHMVPLPASLLKKLDHIVFVVVVLQIGLLRVRVSNKDNNYTDIDQDSKKISLFDVLQS